MGCLLSDSGQTVTDPPLNAHRHNLERSLLADPWTTVKEADLSKSLAAESRPRCVSSPGCGVSPAPVLSVPRVWSPV